MKQCCFLVLWCISLFGYSQNPNIKDLSAYLDILSEHNRFMGVVAIQQGETVLFESTYGYRSIEKNLKNTMETSFRLGAISKTVTATMVLQLVEEGKLQLNSKLNGYFPQIPNSDQITIDHLLRHQSGVYDVVGAYTELSSEFPKDESILWQHIKSQSPEFQSGKKTVYNHTNYWLLGKIIEKIDKRSYAESMASRINTISSSFQLTDGHPADILKNEAYSYISNGKSWMSAGEISTDLTMGSGSLIGSVYDIIGFYYLLMATENVLKKKTKRQLLNIDKNGYGAGIFKLPYDTIKGYGHTGAIDGFRTRIAYFPESDITMAILINGLNYDMEAIASTVVRSIQGEDIELPLFATIALEEEQLQALTGIFHSTQTKVPLTISVIKGDITLQAGNESPIILEVESDTLFSFAALDIEIQFDGFNGSKYQRLIFSENNQRFIFNRN